MAVFQTQGSKVTASPFTAKNTRSNAQAEALSVSDDMHLGILHIKFFQNTEQRIAFCFFCCSVVIKY